MRGDDLIEDVGKQLAPFLDRIQTRGPEEERGIGIDRESNTLLKACFVYALPFNVRLGCVVLLEECIRFRIRFWIRCVENACCTFMLILLEHFVANIAWDETVLSSTHFLEEGWTYRVDEVSAEDPAGQKIDGIVVS